MYLEVFFPFDSVVIKTENADRYSIQKVKIILLSFIYHSLLIAVSDKYFCQK